VIDVPNVDAMSKKLKEAYYKAEEAIREDEMVAYYEQRWFERGF
jgi:tetrahydromethanopterin S-methyltransferase subunit A